MSNCDVGGGALDSVSSLRFFASTPSGITFTAPALDIALRFLVVTVRRRWLVVDGKKEQSFDATRF